MVPNRRGFESAGDRCIENKNCFARSSPDTLQKRDDMTERNKNALVSVSIVGPDIIIEIVLLEGNNDLDAMHQVMQYI
jgi:hypothetical protein